MKLLPLGAEVAALTGFTHKAILTFADFTAAAGASDTVATVQIYPETAGTAFPIGTAVTRCAMKLVTAFDASDAAINSLALTVGDGGDVDRFLDSTELAVDGTEITFKASKVTTFPHAYTAADGIDAQVTVAGGASPLIDELTSGEVEIYLAIVDLNALAVPKQA